MRVIILLKEKVHVINRHIKHYKAKYYKIKD